MARSHRHAERVAKFADIDLYPVTCEALSAGRDDETVLRGIIAGGARVVQLRDKLSDHATLLAKARLFRELTRDAGMLLIINDYVDIALEVDADGIHLGQDDEALAKARLAFPDGIIGISSHNMAEAHIAVAGGADYTNIGPVYATATKDVPCPPVGLELVREAHETLPIPLTVMGGIKLAHVPGLVAAGARRIAVVTAITQAPDIVAAVREWRSALH
ncbi:MAG: thiamine-phosphate pyrophosphorylase [Rhodothermales bacterium]